MKKGIISKLSLLSALIIFTLTSLSGFSQTYHKDYIDGQIYFKFKDQVQVNIPVNPDKSVDLDNAPFLASLRQQFDITGMSRPYDANNDPKLLRTFKLFFSDYDKIEQVKEQLSANNDLEYVESVPLYYIDYTPNDSLYNRDFGYSNWNWHLDVIDAELAWDLNMGSAEIKVAVVDNAVWIDHPDLEDKIVLSHDVTTAGNQNSNPPSGGDPAEWSHGTHCAGLVGAETDNLIGVASIGYHVSLIGVKASSSNPNQINGGFSGINWAANNGADVISCSWGGSGYSTSEQNLINTVYGMGVIVVGAAGNNNVNTPHYPSAYNHVIDKVNTGRSIKSANNRVNKPLRQMGDLRRTNKMASINSATIEVAVLSPVERERGRGTRTRHFCRQTCPLPGARNAGGPAPGGPAAASAGAGVADRAIYGLFHGVRGTKCHAPCG